MSTNEFVSLINRQSYNAFEWYTAVQNVGSMAQVDSVIGQAIRRCGEINVLTTFKFIKHYRQKLLNLKHDGRAYNELNSNQKEQLQFEIMILGSVLAAFLKEKPELKNDSSMNWRD